MTDYQRIKQTLKKKPFIIADGSSGEVRLVTEAEALKALMEGGEFPSACILNAFEALKRFSKLRDVGEEGKFSLKDISKIAGMGYVNCYQWYEQGVFVPSVKPFRGKGRGKEHEAIFSWADAFVAGLVGSLRRNGLRPGVLKKVRQLFTETKTKKRKKEEEQCQT